MPELALNDIQGFILRTYAMPALRVFALKIENAIAAGRFLEAVVGGEPSVPQITTGAPWASKPDVTVNIGFTYAGLEALGLSIDGLGSFPEDFIEGPIARAARVGDVGESAPQTWKAPL